MKTDDLKDDTQKDNEPSADNTATPEETAHTNIWAINSMAFVLTLIVGGVAFWMIPQKTISEDEKRELTQLPIATQDSLLSGEFGKKFEEYYNDHFVLRDEFMSLASQLNSFKGKQNQEFRVITLAPPKTDTSPQQPSESASNNSEPSSEITTAAMPASASNEPATYRFDFNNKPSNETAITSEIASTTNTQKPSENEEAPPASDINAMQEEFSKVKGMVVVNGRVVQNFGGSKSTITPFIELVNLYYNKLPNIKHYAMIIPAGSDYYLPKQVTKGELKEKQTIDIFNQSINSNITSVPVYEELLAHKNEYIMYRTDHHWTGLGAYYAYRAFAKVAGFTPLELNQMEYVKSNKEFLGSLFLYTKDNELKKNPDFVEYYKIPHQYSVTMQKTTNGKPITGVLYYPNGSNYGVFLGGDYPLVKISSDVKNGKKILLIKDSFGNAFAPFLAAHYEEVFVVDYRYYKASIPKLIQEHTISEFIYAHNSFAANSSAAVNYGKAMLTY